MKNNNLSLKIRFSLFLTASVISSQVFAEKIQFNDLSLQDVANKALQIALDDQVKENNQYYIAGEWTTQIRSSPVPYVAGVGRIFSTDEEASAFTTGSVISVLAQTYLDSSKELSTNETLQKIPAAIQNGINTFSRYESGSVYNFYPEFTTKKGDNVRRPIGMRLLPIWNGFVNIPNDADTTSVANSALLLNAKVNNTGYTVSSETLNQFSQFRDVDRKAHLYNRLYKTKNTGAFMTWLYDEKDENTPISSLSPAEKGPRIPFKVNDVDCIVNANVLKVLALAKNTSIEGYNETCHMLNSMVEKNQDARCGIYYPNTMNLSFALAQANQAGNKCITPSTQELIVEKILKNQREDGSWLNDGNFYKDPVISTAFAMYALLQFGDTSQSRTAYAIAYGTKYLISKAKLDNNGQMQWPIDHFFTATAIVRSLVMWQSKAYTHALIGSVLLKIYKMAPNMKAQDYLNFEIDKTNLKPLRVVKKTGAFK